MPSILDNHEFARLASIQQYANSEKAISQSEKRIQSILNGGFEKDPPDDGLLGANRNAPQGVAGTRIEGCMHASPSL